MTNEMQDLLEWFNKVDIKNLKREGRDFEFTDVFPYIQSVYRDMLTINNYSEFWETLPEPKKNIIFDNLNRFRSHIERIQNFDPAQANAQGTRNTIADEIKREFNHIHDTLNIPLAVYVLQEELSSTDSDNYIKKAKESLTVIKKQEKTGQEALKAIQEASSASGVSEFAGVFGGQAEKDKDGAKKWLIVSGFATVGIIIFISVLFHELSVVLKKSSNDDISVTVQIFLTKLVILSFVSVVFYQIVKNYNARMHQFTLNKHRENSLKTFQAFIKSTDDPKTKDAVLIQATKSIFNAGDTGFVSSKDTGISGIETIKIFDQLKDR